MQKNKTTFILVLLPFWSMSLAGQELISFVGGYVTNSSGSLSWSAGEIAIQNKKEGDWLTEGFQQAELEAIELADANIFIQEGITPNGDGKNDTWEIDSLVNFPDNEMIILNRWGEEVFRAKKYGIEEPWWDGTRNGRKLPAGAYYYWLNFGPGYKPKKGPVYIVH